MSRDDDVLNAAEALQRPFEGFISNPYLDRIANPPVWTIGEGSTHDPAGNPVTAHTPPIDYYTAREWAKGELRKIDAMVRQAVTVPLTIGEEATLVDWVYNLGIGSLRRSTMLRLLNAGDYAGAANELEKWDMAGGVVVAGLLRRRQAEHAEWNQPDPVTV